MSPFSVPFRDEEADEGDADPRTSVCSLGSATVLHCDFAAAAWLLFSRLEVRFSPASRSRRRTSRMT